MKTALQKNQTGYANVGSETRDFFSPLFNHEFSSPADFFKAYCFASCPGPLRKVICIVNDNRSFSYRK